MQYNEKHTDMAISETQNKKITILGRELQYSIESDWDEYGEYYETIFYEGEETISRKKYILFGPIITKQLPKIVFTVDFNIESDRFTKSEIRSLLERKVELLNRSDEISRGEII